MVSERDLKLSGLTLEKYLEKCKATRFTPETDEPCTCPEPMVEAIEEREMWKGNPPPLCRYCLKSV